MLEPLCCRVKIGVSGDVYWDEWFTFLSNPEVKPDNNDAQRALRPIVVHRKVSGGGCCDWGAKLVAQMFSFLETVRLQGGDALPKALAPRARPIVRIVVFSWSKSSWFTLDLNFTWLVIYFVDNKPWF